MSAAIERIRALVAARSATNGTQTTKPVSNTVVVNTVPTPAEVKEAADEFKAAPTMQEEAEAKAKAADPLADPLAGLTGTALVLAKMRLKQQGTIAQTQGVHQGKATGAGTSNALATSNPDAQAKAAAAAIAQRVMTPAERQLAEAKALLQQHEEKGLYNIEEANAARLPQELPAAEVSEKLRELHASLLMRTPQLPNLMIEINRNLRQYDELAYLLTDDQLGLIVNSNLAVKNTILVNSASKAGKGKSATAIASKLAATVTADDL